MWNFSRFSVRSFVCIRHWFLQKVVFGFPRPIKSVAGTFTCFLVFPLSKSDDRYQIGRRISVSEFVSRDQFYPMRGRINYSVGYKCSYNNARCNHIFQNNVHMLAIDKIRYICYITRSKVNSYSGYHAPVFFDNLFCFFALYLFSMKC